MHKNGVILAEVRSLHPKAANLGYFSYNFKFVCVISDSLSAAAMQIGFEPTSLACMDDVDLEFSYRETPLQADDRCLQYNE